MAGVIEEHSREKEVQSNIYRQINESIVELNVCKQINKSIKTLDEEKEEAFKAMTACFALVHTKLQQLESEVDDPIKKEDVLDQFAITSK